MRILIITGLSGSGKSTAIRALEDEGYFCIDNLPVKLFPTFIELVAAAKERVRDVALVMDIRGRDFSIGYEQVFQQLDQAGHRLEIYFFDASDQILLRRFSETRRRHPAGDGMPLADAIRVEREQLAGVRRLATTVIDSSELTVHQLRERFLALVSGGAVAGEMLVQIMSFGFRNGLPLEADLVLDLRFLPNPHFVPELRPGTGLDVAVRAFVVENEEGRMALERFQELLAFLVPRYRREGKSYLTIALGCTGGRHRSVALAEELGAYLRHLGIKPRIVHRDMEKG